MRSGIFLVFLLVLAFILVTYYVGTVSDSLAIGKAIQQVGFFLSGRTGAGTLGSAQDPSLPNTPVIPSWPNTITNPWPLPPGTTIEQSFPSALQGFGQNVVDGWTGAFQSMTATLAALGNHGG